MPSPRDRGADGSRSNPVRVESAGRGSWRLISGQTVVATIALNDLGWWCTPGPDSEFRTTTLHASLAEAADAVGLTAGDLAGVLAPR